MRAVFFILHRLSSQEKELNKNIPVGAVATALHCLNDILHPCLHRHWFWFIIVGEHEDIWKIFAMTNDGTPAVTRKQQRSVRLIEKNVGHSFMKLHCIIHQENHCAKMSNSDLNKVMATLVKVLNFIVKRSALTHTLAVPVPAQKHDLHKQKHCSPPSG